jgi:hypothetical protein
MVAVTDYDSLFYTKERAGFWNAIFHSERKMEGSSNDSRSVFA